MYDGILHFVAKVADLAIDHELTAVRSVTAGKVIR